ncbi:protein of unknown function (DUF948) [Candidatus Kryptobacter tengchongensis]|uniref:DUF948 domain-containing protein n=1 Tax=Kryptobacter tengchongensis TaxID=1643429 RepID=A0A656D4M4_KRYT1|nr:hypothetical protein [Candidatus Kryptobacter tengchongensis]CUS99809.1 protein of unknown function (DUF948) [Candidatus Kryptobacter tengchongensis]CUU01052.1 protein of unknown function (DUF948) [Candidatus Kryptobacter tengchongensis]
MELLIQILTALLLASAVIAIVYLIIVFIRLSSLLENLNKTMGEINSKLPLILENFQRISVQLVDMTSKAQSQFETIQNLSETVQSYLQRFKGVFSSDSSPSLEGFPFGLTRILALIKAIRTVIARLKA